MISGSSGDWIGSVGTAQAATTAPTVAGQVPTPVAAGSFAEVMRQSTQTESEPEETKKPSVKAGAVNVVSSDTVGKEAMKLSSGCSGNELGVSVETRLDAPAEATGSTTAPTPTTPVPRADVDAQDVTAVLELGRHVIAAPIKAEAAVPHPPGVVKPPSEEHGKTKTVPGIKAATGSALDSTSATSDGVSSTAADSAIVDNAAQVGVQQGTVVPAVDPALAAGDKGSKSKTVTVQVSDGTVPTTLPANVSTVENAAVKSQDHDVVPTPIAVEGLSAAQPFAAPLQSSVVQSVALPMHGAGVIPGSAAVVQGREEAAALAVAQSHGQSSGTNELTLSSYDSAKSNQLEVGLQSGELGWLKVRAELGSNGEVNAYLRGASTSATDFLQAQAPRIEGYLGASDVAVSSVHVEPTQTMQHHVAATQDFGGGDPGARSETPQHQRGSSSKGSSDAVQVVGDATGLDLLGEEFLPAQVMVNQNATVLPGTGTWLSIRA